MAINWQRIGRRALQRLTHAVGKNQRHQDAQPARTSTVRQIRRMASPGQLGPDATIEVRAHEVHGARTSYAPNLDGDPDPGEVVWTWVPYVENDGRGKDRPVLIVARIDDTSVLGCYLTSKPQGGYLSMGTGDWDASGRESFLNPVRLLRITNEGMRREGAVMPRERFNRAVSALHDHHRELF